MATFHEQRVEQKKKLRQALVLMGEGATVTEAARRVKRSRRWLELMMRELPADVLERLPRLMVGAA